MSDNESNFTGATQAMMGTAAGAIGQISSSAGQALSALSEIIGGFSAKITGTPRFDGWEDMDFTTPAIDILGVHVSDGITFPIKVPKFSLEVSGEATGNTSNAVSNLTSALSSGGNALKTLGGAMSKIGLSDWKPGGSNSNGASPSQFPGTGGSGGGGGGGGKEGKAKEADNGL